MEVGALRSTLGALEEEWGFSRSSWQMLPGSVLFSSSSQVAFAHWEPWHREVSPGGATVWTSKPALLPPFLLGQEPIAALAKRKLMHSLALA